MSHRPRILTTLLVLAACAVGAAPAAAQIEEEEHVTIKTFYAVTIEGEAFYNVARITPTKWGDQTHQEDNQFKFRTEIPQIDFFDEIGSDSKISMGTGSSVRGHVTTINPNGSRIDCDGSEISGFEPGRLVGSMAHKATVYKVRVLQAVRILMQCNGLPYEKGFQSFGDVGTGMWDAEFTVPMGMLGQEEMRFPIANTVSGPECPGFDEETTICELSFEGEVVFKKTGWSEVRYGDAAKDGVREERHYPVQPGEPLVVPQPQPQPQPEPQPAPVQPAFEALSADASLSASALTVPVTCAAGCAGTATVTLPAGAKARAAAKAKPIAKTRFEVAPGATAKVRVKIPARARKAVRRAGAVKVTLAVTPTGGARQTKKLTVKLRRP